jgi:predicted RNase H-like HicB family nuclease
MKYPVYIHQQGDSAFGTTFPDVAGLFTASDSIDDLERAAQEAFELYFEGEPIDVPAPGNLSELSKDPQYQGGFWLLLEIDLDQVNSKPMRLNISLPAGLVSKIDRCAARKHMNRSAFLAKAALDAMRSESA